MAILQDSLGKKTNMTKDINMNWRLIAKIFKFEKRVFTESALIEQGR
jgi:hypothetical protein